MPYIASAYPANAHHHYTTRVGQTSLSERSEVLVCH